MDSILTSVKKLLGIDEAYEAFDTDIIMFINSVFVILAQMGVGSPEPFVIKDKENTWDEFFRDGEQIEMVKTYIYMKVRTMFDPPQGAAAQAIEKAISEFEWRLNFQYDPMDLIGED